MVYKFRLISDEVKDFVRDIELLSEQTFYDFHCALTQNLHYDESQIASFFISNEEWEKLAEITLFDMAEGKTHDLHVMDRTYLSDFFNKERQRLLYVFDFFNERLFFIELSEISKRKPGLVYPRFSYNRGNSPQQILMDNLPFEDLGFDE